MGINISHTTCVHYAAQDGRANDLLFHLERAGKQALDAIPGRLDQRTPLHLAAAGGHTVCIQVLREAGAALNQTLIGAGADPNAREAWGLTPLMVAAQKSHADMIKLLLVCGVDREAKDHHHGQTALHVACAVKDEKCLLQLLDADCDVHSVDKQGCSPLGIAMISRFFTGLPLLREYGARLNAADRQHIPQPLLSRYEQPENEPRSLLRITRVAYRKTVQAWNDEWLASSALPEKLKDFVVSMHNLCKTRMHEGGLE
ncbi:hypothetical protein EMCRGX_G027468 [Ephydatia muelleri]